MKNVLMGAVGAVMGILLPVSAINAELLGVGGLDRPLINYNSTGELTYDANVDALTVDATPTSILFEGGPPIFIDPPRTMEIRIRVDELGSLVGGVEGPDLMVEGVIDPEFSGVLLTGEIVAFGFRDTGSNTDKYDFVFTLTGGALGSFYNGGFIGITLTSEGSDFEGDFTVDFSGEAKGTIGVIRCLEVTKEGCVIPPPPSPSDACDGKLTQLTLRYTGEGCEATEHNQRPGKVICEGDANDAEPVRILVTDKDGGRVYADVPSVPLDGEIVAAAENAGENHFKAETRVTIFNADGVEIESVLFHTSCSQPLAPGNQFGSMFVQGMITTNGGEVIFEEPTEECITEFLPSTGDQCDGKLINLELRYNGGDCSQTDHSQDPRKVSCDGNAGEAEPVRILVTNKNGNRVYADVESVQLGGIVLASAANAGRGHFDAETKVRIFDVDENQLQEVKFHTSCSQPLELGNRFGAVEVFGMETTRGGSGSLGAEVEYTYTVTNVCTDIFSNVTVIDDVFGEVPGSPIPSIQPDETVELMLTEIIFETTTNTVTVTAPDVEILEGVIVDCVGTATATITKLEPPPRGVDCCESGHKLQIVSAVYTGASCEATHHSQDPNKVFCEGDPMAEDTVAIRASDKEDPNDDRAKVWFSGTVNLDEQFDIDAQNAGKDKLKAKTWVHIFDLDGNLLQTVKFHTSCSQPLFEGDEFGSVKVVGCTPEGGPTEGQFCVGGAKPRILTMRYDGRDCGATQHSQDPDKVQCVGDPEGATPVQIRASDKEDPQDHRAKVWFAGEVALGATFDIDAGNADANKLKAKTWVHIWDLNGDLLQTVLFHTSCSQPLNEGDQFGSLILEGFTPE